MSLADIIHLIFCFVLSHICATLLHSILNVGGDSSVVRAPDSWLRGRGFESLQDWWENFLFHPCVTAVARKRSRSFCQKCRWQVTAKHAYTLRMWLCMKWHGAWLCGVHRTCAETAAVSCGTSHANTVSTPLRWIFKKQQQKNAIKS